jgi:AraC-like DNA-binding protein
VLKNELPKRFSVSYRGFAKGASYESWQDEICRGFCRLDVGPAEIDYIDCHNDFTLLHSVSLAIPKGVSARFARTRALLDDGCDDLVLISATLGKVRVTQENKTIDLTAGQMCLTEMNVIGAVNLNRTGAFTTTRLPRNLVLQIAPSAEAQLARPIGHDAALSTMILRYFTLCSDIGHGLDRPGQEAAARHLTDLIALLLKTGVEQREFIKQDALSSARLDLLKSDTIKRLSNSDLTVDTIAKSNRLSKRQAQRLFAQQGITFSEFLLEERLLSARRLLLHETGRVRKVSDIAFAVGFNDLSYFHRSFRKRFGVTPSDMRQG